MQTSCQESLFRKKMQQRMTTSCHLHACLMCEFMLD